MKRRLLTSGIVAIVMALCAAFGTMAQNNPYKIDDRLYARYNKAYKLRRDPVCLAMADSIYRDALRIADGKAACVGLTIPVRYYSNEGDSLGLVQAVERLKRVSRQQGYLQYYYFAYNTLITWMLRRGSTLTALQVSQQMREQALADNHHYGYYICMRAQGNIYFARGNNDLGAQCYRQAYEYQQRYLPEQSATTVLIYLSKYYASKGDNQQALLYAQKAVEEAKTPETLIYAQVILCRSYFHNQRIEEFNALFDQIKPTIDKMGWNEENLYTSLCIYRAVLDDDPETAISLANQLNQRSFRYSTMQYIYAAMHDFKTALEYGDIRGAFIDSVRAQIYGQDMAEISVQMANERTQRIAHEREIENTQLQLANAQLELQQAQAMAQMEQALAENHLLELRNNELELEQLNLMVEHRDMVQQEREHIMQMRTIVLAVAAILLLALITVLMVMTRKRRKLVAALEESHSNLTVARDHAIESDKMKMEFLKNVSHEIRTPLNSIVGFSQLLTDDDAPISDDEKAEFCRQITRNSDLLMMLINDVLDLSRLESGRTPVVVGPCGCNELCRQAMEQVVRLKPQGVEMRFTTAVDDDFKINTDGTMAQQVLFNYLTNAVKFVTPGGRIHVDCQHDEERGCVTFAVANTGPRITAEQAASIFDRFYKVNALTQGTGLGLSICHLIAEKLHGRVECDSSYDQGARFTFSLPV